jgi:hypothetical protein
MTVGLVAAALLQVFTPFPVLIWLGELKKNVGWLIKRSHKPEYRGWERMRN